MEPLGISFPELHRLVAEGIIEKVGAGLHRLAGRWKSSERRLARCRPKRRPRIPRFLWRAIMAMRHRLIHRFGEVRLDRVWSVLRDDLGRVDKSIDARISF